MITYVYKITRLDGLEYIGITIDPSRRFKQHEKSNRFKIGIRETIILEECNSYELAEERETFYIDYYDSYNKGLNCTPQGKGRNENCKFNTLGFSYSEASRLKMSISAKKRGVHSNHFIPDKEFKRKVSEQRKGKRCGNIKISDEDAAYIFQTYLNDEIEFDKEFILRYVKKSQHITFNQIPFEMLITSSGTPLTKDTLYRYYFAEKYNVTPATIRLIIKNKGKRCPKFKL